MSPDSEDVDVYEVCITLHPRWHWLNPQAQIDATTPIINQLFYCPLLIREYGFYAELTKNNVIHWHGYVQTDRLSTTFNSGKKKWEYKDVFRKLRDMLKPKLAVFGRCRIAHVRHHQQYYDYIKKDHDYMRLEYDGTKIFNRLRASEDTPKQSLVNLLEDCRAEGAI